MSGKTILRACHGAGPFALLLAGATAAQAQAQAQLPRIEFQFEGFDFRLTGGAAAQAAVFDDDDVTTSSPDAQVDLFARLNAQWTSPDGIIVGFNVEQNGRRRASEVLEAGEIYGFWPVICPSSEHLAQLVA